MIILYGFVTTFFWLVDYFQTDASGGRLFFRPPVGVPNVEILKTGIASPWQNGRVERLIGTFKEKVCQVLVQDQAHLVYLLPQFQF